MLLRITRPVPAPSPLAAFDRAWRAGLDATLWLEPARQRCFATLGAVGDDRAPDLTTAAALFARHRAALIEDDAAFSDAPLAVFAAAFDPARPAHPGWPGWPATMLRVPRVVITDSPTRGERWLTLTARIDPGFAGTHTDDPTLAAALAAAWTEATAPAPEPAAEPTSSQPFTGPAHPEETRDHWLHRVTALRDACRAGHLTKVVPARAARFTAPPGRRFDPTATLLALAAAEPDAHVFAFTHHGRAFVGATPERLLALTGRTLDTHALAGTTRRDPDPARDAALGEALLRNAKDRHEHTIVVDAITHALAAIADPIAAAPTHLRRLGAVQHLETPITARLREGIGLLDAVSALHPTPALGGAPHHAALAALADEPLDRGGYGGPIGYLTAHGDGLAAVAIRSALIAPDLARAFAGAGVVAASDPAAEWDETALKLGTIGHALRLEAVK